MFIIITKTTNIINLDVADVAVRLLLGYQSLIECKPLECVTMNMHEYESEVQKTSYLVAVNCCENACKYVQINFMVTVCNCSCSVVVQSLHRSVTLNNRVSDCLPVQRWNLC